MYHVIKQLKGINSIFVTALGNMEEGTDIPMTGLSLEFCGKAITFPLKKYHKEWENYDNNIELTGPNLKTKLQILQDYGDYEGVLNANGKDFPRQLIFPTGRGSIGWYDGYICYILPIAERLFVIKLQEHECIDFTCINNKRPFTLFTFFYNDDPNKLANIEIHLLKRWVNMGTGQVQGDIEYLTVSTPWTYETLTAPDKLYDQIVNAENLPYRFNKKYISFNDLVVRGFNLVNNGVTKDNTTYWQKGRFKLYTNGYGYPNDYFWVGSGDDKKYIFRVKELDKLLKEKNIEETEN